MPNLDWSSSATQPPAAADYRSLFDYAPYGIFRTLPNGRCIAANPALAQILGYESPEHLMAALSDINQQVYVDPQRRQEFLRTVAERGTVSRFESQVYRRDGTVIWIGETARTVLDEQGQVLYYEGFVEDVTERHWTAAQYAESVSLLQATLEATADGILVIDQARNVPVYNQKFMQMWSMPEELMQPSRSEERLRYLASQVLDPEGFIAKILDLFFHRPDAIVADLLELKDGRVFERHTYPQWRGDQIIGRVWSFRDATKRIRAEEALRESEERYRSVIAAMAEGIILQDADGQIVECNASAERILGLSHHQLKGRTSADPGWVSIHEDGTPFPSDRHPAMITLRTGKPVSGVTMGICRPDRETVWISINSQPLLQPGETRPYAVVSSFTDITQYKQAEAALRRSERKYRTIFENSQVGIFRTRLEDGLILEANQRYIDSTGYSADELIGRKYASEFYVEQGDRQTIIDHLIQHGQYTSYEVQYRRRDGSTGWGLYSIHLNRDEGCIEGVETDITQLKQLQEELRQSKQFLDSIIQNIPVGLFAKDVNQDFRYVLVNQQAESIIGVTCDRALGHNDAELVAPERAAMHRQEDLAVVDSKTLTELTEHWIDHPSGRRMLIRGLKFPLIDLQGRVTHLLGLFEDITDWWNREQALRLIVEGTAATTGDEFFKSCMRYLAEVLQMQYALVTEFANAEKTRVRTLAFFGDLPLSDSFEYDLRGTPCETVLQGEICYFPQTVQQMFPDDVHLVDLGIESYLGIPLVDSTGAVLGHMAVLDTKPMQPDLGRELILKIFAARAGAELERKQADAALERRAQIEGMLSSISRHFIDQDAPTAIEFALKAIALFAGAERGCLFEYSDQHRSCYLVQQWCAIGIAPLVELAQEIPVARFPEFHALLLSDNAIQIPRVRELPDTVAEATILKRESIQSLLAVPMTHAGQVVGFLGVDTVQYCCSWSEEEINLIRLVGELIAIGRSRYQAEAALRVAKDAAEAANRAKSTFLANMSHELRTPLNAILGFARLMDRDVTLTHRQREFLTTINRSGEHLLNLINDVLDMSKIEAGQMALNPAPFDLYALLHALRELFQMRAESKHLGLEFDVHSTVPRYVLTDEGKLRQVLINLLGNAIKFTRQGQVTLRVSVGDAIVLTDANPDAAPPSSSNLALRFAVEDTGPGIAPDDIHQLFQPFVQVMTQAHWQEGTGLGLTISRQFVRLLGGDMRIQSVVGQGTTFTVTIPVTPIEASAELLQSTHPPRVIGLAPDQPRYRILVVDDRSENRELINQLLQWVGFETRTATNGQEAIALWERWQPHLIWMDMRMPIMDGYEATRHIRMVEREQLSPLPVPTKIIALTASAFEEQRSQILSAGCDDFVRKPFQEHLIFDKMAQHLGVQYLYDCNDEIPESSASPDALSPAPSSTLDLTVMPEAWIVDLQQAAMRVNAKMVMQLIGQIPEAHHGLAIALQDWVDHYRFDRIVELTQSLHTDPPV